MLLPRIVSAVILAPLFLALVYFGFPGFNLLICAIAAIIAAEFARMDGERGTKRRSLIALGTFATVALMPFIGGVYALIVVLLIALGVVIADRFAGRRGLSLVYAAVPYAALPALALIYIREFGAVSIFWLLAVVWATDIGAYACGRLIGGPKLAPAISPKKTWAGAVGGLLCGLGASAGLMAWLDVQVDGALIVTALVVSLIAEAGDLLESALKRWYEVKDSGTLIPGHGGLMDRFDGLWAAAPIAALFCRFLGGGVNQW